MVVVGDDVVVLGEEFFGLVFLVVFVEWVVVD